MKPSFLLVFLMTVAAAFTDDAIKIVDTAARAEVGIDPPQP